MKTRQVLRDQPSAANGLDGNEDARPDMDSQKGSRTIVFSPEESKNER